MCNLFMLELEPGLKRPGSNVCVPRFTFIRRRPFMLISFCDFGIPSFEAILERVLDTFMVMLVGSRLLYQRGISLGSRRWSGVVVCLRGTETGPLSSLLVSWSRVQQDTQDAVFSFESLFSCRPCLAYFSVSCWWCVKIKDSFFRFISRCRPNLGIYEYLKLPKPSCQHILLYFRVQSPEGSFLD